MASIQQVTVPAAQATVNSANVGVQFYDWHTGTWKPFPGLTSLSQASARGYMNLGQGIYWKYGSSSGGGVGASWINLRENPNPGSTTPSFGSPMASSPNLDVTFDAWGSTIPYFMGHCRVMGKMIWGSGLESGTSVASPAFLSFAIGFGYPLDPLEWQWIECIAIWANGIKIFGGANDLPGLSFTFYEGKEDAPIDPLIIADKGASRTPAFRGLRTIVFNQFPLAVVGNSLPMISAEFALSKAAPAPVVYIADVLTKLAAKSNVTLTTSANFTDFCDGVVFMGDVATVALMRDLMPTYNYQIKDALGASIVRRAVDDTLTIDDTLSITDIVGKAANVPAVTASRSEPAEIANMAQIQYTDPDRAFTNSIQYARRPIFPVREALSDQRMNIQLPFAIEAILAISLACDQLYRGITENLTLKFYVSFKSGGLQYEVGDVLDLELDGLGDHTARVTNSTLHFSDDAYNELTCTRLKKTSAIFPNADSGAADYVADTIIAALNYPDIIYADTSSVIANTNWGQIAIVDGAIVTFASTGGFSAKFGFMFAPSSVPSKASAGNLVPYGGSTPPVAANTGQILTDTTYVYIVDWTQSGIQRINRGNIADTKYVDLTGSTLGLAGSGNQFAISGGYMYWADAPASARVMKAWRLDLSLFSAAGLTSLSLDGDTTTFVQKGACVVGTALLLTTYDTSSAKARIYNIDLTDPTFATFTSHNTIGEPAAGQGYLGRGVVSGSHAFFLPIEPGSESSGKSTQKYGAKVDPTALGSISYFDITGDVSVTSLSIGNVFPWADATNFYFLANDDHSGSPYKQFLAARNLTSLSVVTGFDLTTVYDDTKFDFWHGTSDGTSHYITGANLSDKLGALIKVTGLASAELFYRGNSSAPGNDNFANASPIALGTTITTSNIAATKEAGEPNHAGNAGGTSIWYAFTPTAPATVTVDASTSDIDVLIGVYTGTVVGSLSTVASNAFGSVSFSAVSGTHYMIALDGFDGVSGAIKFTIS